MPMPRKTRMRAALHGGVVLTTATILALPIVGTSSTTAKRPPNGKTADTTSVAKSFESSHKRPPNG